MPQEPSLALQRHIRAPATRIFAAWTDPAQLMQWFGPAGALVLSAETDPRAGGRYAITFRVRDGDEHGVQGHYLDVIEDRKLVFTWAWRTTPERESLVTVIFEPDANGTTLKLVHERFADEPARDRHREGWTSTIDKLEHYAAQVKSSQNVER